MISDKTPLNISIIGIGNAGNQLLNEAVKHEFDVFAINSSYADLQNAVVNEEVKSFIIGDEARGAGKNRDIALNLFKKNGKQLVTQVTPFVEMCERSDIIIVSGSTAGGTGSGVAPTMVNFLKQSYPSKIIIYCGILPRLTDSVQAQKNSIECINEIVKLEVPFMLADLDYYADVPNDIAYREVQKYICDCINTIKGKYLNESSFGMIDENDMRMVIAEPGYLSVYNLDKISQKQLDQESMQDMMIKKIKRSPATDIMRDGIVRKMAAIINMPDDMTDSSKASDYETLIGYIGRPLAIFENYAIVDGAVGQIAIILSGQTTPFTRISKMHEIVKDYEEKSKKQKKIDLDSMISTEKNVIPSFFDASDKKDEEKKASIDSFFDSL